MSTANPTCLSGTTLVPFDTGDPALGLIGNTPTTPYSGRDRSLCKRESVTLARALEGRIVPIIGDSGEQYFDALFGE